MNAVKGYIEKRADDAISAEAREAQEKTWMEELEAEMAEAFKGVPAEATWQDVQDADEDMDVDTLAELAKLNIRVMRGVA